MWYHVGGSVERQAVPPSSSLSHALAASTGGGGGHRLNVTHLALHWQYGLITRDNAGTASRVAADMYRHGQAFELPGSGGVCIKIDGHLRVLPVAAARRILNGTKIPPLPAPPGSAAWNQMGAPLGDDTRLLTAGDGEVFLVSAGVKRLLSPRVALWSYLAEPARVGRAELEQLPTGPPIGTHS